MSVERVVVYDKASVLGHDKQGDFVEGLGRVYVLVVAETDGLGQHNAARALHGKRAIPLLDLALHDDMPTEVDGYKVVGATKTCANGAALKPAHDGNGKGHRGAGTAKNAAILEVPENILHRVGDHLARGGDKFERVSSRDAVLGDRAYDVSASPAQKALVARLIFFGLINTHKLFYPFPPLFDARCRDKALSGLVSAVVVPLVFPQFAR